MGTEDKTRTGLKKPQIDTLKVQIIEDTLFEDNHNINKR